MQIDDDAQGGLASVWSIDADIGAGIAGLQLRNRFRVLIRREQISGLPNRPILVAPGPKGPVELTL